MLSCRYARIKERCWSIFFNNDNIYFFGQVKTIKKMLFSILLITFEKPEEHEYLGATSNTKNDRSKEINIRTNEAENTFVHY